MILPRHSDSFDVSPKSTPAPAASPPRGVVERDWFTSSRDLAEGLDVQEILETIPAELLPDV
jgi:hypothetical protein